MSTEAEIRSQMTKMFSSLKSYPPGHLPSIGELSSSLAVVAPPKGTQSSTHNLTNPLTQMLCTASINMWQRSVHSFLISASLTSASPVWASISGYYSSHYAVRALAHALGFFHLFRIKRNVQVSLKAGGLSASFQQKASSDREHQIYWSVVKLSPLFASDPLFTFNNSDQGPSDAQHRDVGNYADHVPQLPQFSPLDREELISRVEQIAEIEISAPPIPDWTRFPEVEAVQIVAYHRLVKFRDLLDDILGDSNRYWTRARSPAWASNFLDYQIVETNPSGTR